MSWKDNYKKNNPKITKENTEIIIQDYFAYLNNEGTDYYISDHEGKFFIKLNEISYWVSSENALHIANENNNNNTKIRCMVYLTPDNKYTIHSFKDRRVIDAFESYNRDVIDRAIKYVVTGE